MSEQTVRNMEEFATVSGISRPTLSKYFNDPDSVRPTTRARIEAALEEHDYRPNIYAINQNRRLTKTIGIVVPYLSDPFFAEIARNIENLCIDAGFRPILLSSHGDQGQENDNLDSVRGLKPAGVLLAPLGRGSDRAVIERFCDAVPTVLFDSNIDDVGEAFVGMDNAQAVGSIVQYLCNSGEPPVFFEMRDAPNPNANKRRTAYRATMERLGLEPQVISVDGDGWDFEEIGCRQGKRVIARREMRTNTVLCSNDRLAIGFLAAAYQSGLRVGRGDSFALRVAGLDDHPFSRFTCPTLTTVSQDYAAIAERSVEELMSLIESPDARDARHTTLFDGKLILRDSA